MFVFNYLLGSSTPSQNAPSASKTHTPPIDGLSECVDTIAQKKFNSEDSHIDRQTSPMSLKRAKKELSKQLRTLPAEEKSHLLNYLSRSLGVIFTHTNSYIAFLKVTEKHFWDLKQNKGKLKENLCNFQERLEEYTKVVNAYGEEYKIVHPEEKEDKKKEILSKLWAYKENFANYICIAKEMKSQENATLQLNKEVNKIVDLNLDELSKAEDELNDKFAILQDAMRLLENALTSEENTEVVNVPKQNDPRPAFLVQVKGESPIEKIVREVHENSEIERNSNWPVYKFELVYKTDPDRKKEIHDFFLKILFPEIAQIIPCELTLVEYDEENFTKLFQNVLLLKKENELLANKLLAYAKEIGGITAQLKLQKTKEITKTAQALKPAYKDLYRDGQLLLNRIQARRQELEAIKKKLNDQLELSLKDLNSRKQELSGRFEALRYSSEWTMDMIRSERATLSTQIGPWLGTERFRHPDRNETPFVERYVEFFKENGFDEKFKTTAITETVLAASDEESEDLSEAETEVIEEGTETLIMASDEVVEEAEVVID